MTRYTHVSNLRRLWWRAQNMLRAWALQRFCEPPVAEMEAQVEDALYSTKRDYKVCRYSPDWRTEDALSGR